MFEKLGGVCYDGVCYYRFGRGGLVIPIFILLLLFGLTSLPAAEPDYTLHLGGQSFDPLTSLPQAAPGLAPLSHHGDDLYLIQGFGPLNANAFADLRDMRLAPVAHIPPHSYVVWGSPAANLQARADWIRWIGPFQPGWRLTPMFRSSDPAPVDYLILTAARADQDLILQALTALGAVKTKASSLSATLSAISVRLPADLARRAAAIPGVYTIQAVPKDGGDRDEMSNQVVVNNVDEGNLAFPGYAQWLADTGLDGSGVIAANVDSGINDQHPDLIGRMLPCFGESCGGNQQSTHGSHTAGIMVGDGTFNSTDNLGFNRGLGIAPAGQIVEQVYLGFSNSPAGMLQLITESHRNGAVLSNNSWGPSGTPRGYDAFTLQVDIGVRDADPEAPGNQPFTYVLAIMNGHGGISSQGTPDEAKNLIRVGSTWMRDSAANPRTDIYSISDNSAHGPCLDGRNLADVVAPGKYVFSTILGTGYRVLDGTSMAAPHVAGGAMLFYQYYRGLPFNTAAADPSPALVKAALLAPSRDLTGDLDADGRPIEHIFDRKQGWGRFNLDAVVDPQNPVQYYDNPTVFEVNGQFWQTHIEIVDDSQPAYIMLVWTDAPGHGLGGAAPALNNDLNLSVSQEKTTYLGNVFSPQGWSEAGGEADDMHNTEAVRLAAGHSGAFQIQVDAANIAWDGIPNTGPLTDQDFALVCYNCRTSLTGLLPGWPHKESIITIMDQYFQ